jgi:hypothetical protein
MKTRLYYSFMVGTAIAMGNMRGNPESQERPAIITLLNTKSPAPGQPAQASTENQIPSLDDQRSGNQSASGDVALTA